MSLLAVTGGTGFVGGTLLDLAVARGQRVRALARRPQPPRAGIEWVAGALDDPAALGDLVAGADAVIHIAGVINAPTRQGFVDGNIAGTRAIVEAAREGEVARLIHVSSLAAREPELSDYGWSKLGAETVVAASGLDWTMVRPPAIYGPGDREMLELFRMARRGLVALPPAGRLSLIEIGDLARLLLALVPAETSHGAIYEIDDGTPGGLTHRDFALALGAAVGRRVRTIAMPAWALRTAARADRALRGRNAKLTPDRVRYFCHPDWVSRTEAAPPPEVWVPEVSPAVGLARTAQAYRAAGWL